MAHLQDDTRYLSNSYLPLGVLNFFVYGTLVIFAAFFQLYLKEIGMNMLEIGSLMAIGPLVSLFAHPLWRYFSDRLRNVRLILLAMLIGLLIIGHLVFRANTFSMLYFTMLLLFFFQSPLLAQTNSLTLGMIENTDRRYGAFRLWGSLGWSFIALTAGPIIDAVGQNGTSVLFSLMLLLSVGSALLLPRSRMTTNTPWITGREIRLTLQNKYFLAFVGFGVLVSIPNAINGIFMPLFMNDLGGSKLEVGGAIFLSTLFEVVVFVLLRRYVKTKITYLMGCLTIVSLLFAIRWDLMGEATHPVQIIFIQVLHAVTFGGFFYVGTRLTGLFLPKPLRSAGQAVYTFALSGSAGVIAGLLGGWLFQNFGPVAMYKLGVIITLLGTIGFAFMWQILRVNGYTPAMAHTPPDEL
ncbi:MFS transporter [Paenibacillus apis]|uniref:MFS metabolite transporter n=1 Tax=Paenibacillus apis TaxID=1792174 RepID=A0A919Y2F8_9BACL|nr:MFS transporter [Paenibacillus apis]GIO42098.1 MFS metabolite transporter [Paenibacillus apis]